MEFDTEMTKENTAMVKKILLEAGIDCEKGEFLLRQFEDKPNEGLSEKEQAKNRKRKSRLLARLKMFMSLAVLVGALVLSKSGGESSCLNCMSDSGKSCCDFIEPDLQSSVAPKSCNQIVLGPKSCSSVTGEVLLLASGSGKSCMAAMSGKSCSSVTGEVLLLAKSCMASMSEKPYLRRRAHANPILQLVDSGKSCVA